AKPLKRPRKRVLSLFSCLLMEDLWERDGQLPWQQREARFLLGMQNRVRAEPSNSTNDSSITQTSSVKCTRHVEELGYSELALDSNKEYEDMEHIPDEHYQVSPATPFLAEFHDFDLDRQKSVFAKGQIWATYDEHGMPRKYVRIEEVISITDLFTRKRGYDCYSCYDYVSTKEEGFKVRVTWLRPERFWMNLVGFAKSYGLFLNLKKTVVENHRVFSHLVSSTGVIKNGDYTICPKKGEVWAVFKYGNGHRRKQEYQIIEIVEGSWHSDNLYVVYLIKQKCVKNVFKRKSDKGFYLSSKSMYSHQIPAFRFLVEESNSMLNGCLELDPLSMPDLLDDFSESLEQGENEERRLYSYFLDLKCDNRHMFCEDRIWAAYDPRDGMPRLYARINKIRHKVQTILVTWLEPDSAKDDNKKW
ncbi:hypothetical protein GIB67_004018, partial [Kingdonia uniflora]